MRDNLCKIKVWTCVVIFDEYESADSQLIALYVNSNKLKRSYTKKISQHIFAEYEQNIQ